MNLFSTLRVGCNDSLHSSSNCCSVVIGHFYFTEKSKRKVNSIQLSLNS